MTNLTSAPRNAILHGDCIDLLGSIAPANVDFALTEAGIILRQLLWLEPG